MEKTFEELFNHQENWIEKIEILPFAPMEDYLWKPKVIELMQQVREATIAEAVEFCVSQDWIKTIDNLKRLPKDRIYQFENKRD